MKTRSNGTLPRVSSMWFVLAAVVFLGCGCGTYPASAQGWDNTQPKNAYTDYNANYYYSSGGYYYFSSAVHGSTHDGFWTSAEKITMANDALIWANAHDTGDVAAYKTEVLNLANGFRHVHGDNWSSDPFNDDLAVAVIAFAWAYHETGSSILLTDAQNNFNTIWSRAQAGDGGLCEETVTPPNCYENSSANWSFAIAGWLIDWANGHQGNYLSEANSVYNWALSNLYVSSTGEVYDAVRAGTQYDYNYGYAIGSAALRGDGTTVTNMTNYLMTNLNNPTYPYDGTYNGYNILPNYGQGQTDNDGGFNGITMRWTGYGYARGLMPSTFLPWAQANVGHAWANRNVSGLSWDAWNQSTPPNVQNGQPYSWDCSSTLVGLFDIPAPD